jgi:uncharacterized protein (UPF0147 family)
VVAPDMDLPRQVRKAAADINETLKPLVDYREHVCADRARKAQYQLEMLVEMVSQSAERRQPWSYFRPRVSEEFGED